MRHLSCYWNWMNLFSFCAQGLGGRRLAAGLALGFWLGVVPLAARAGTIYVKTTGADTNDGLSWGTAKKTVGAGLTAAVSGDQVWVAGGTYRERITLKSGVALYGGFAGSETELSQRNWAANRTVLDGTSNVIVVTVPGGATESIRIDGFTIRNGTGSGIQCYSEVTISNNLITGNAGSGIYARAHCVIVNNRIMRNSGGISCTSHPCTIVNNTITRNFASQGGGIYYASSLAGLVIANNIVAFNSSGIYKGGGAAVTLQNNCVYNPDGANYTGVNAGANDISVDPQLLMVDLGEVHLKAGSPCIDAGDDTSVQPDWVDMDAQARVQGAHVDIGADEFDGTTPSYAPPAIRVSTSGNDANDGSTWALAKLTVQAGIDAASAVGRAEVWVATGTYNQRITLKQGAYVYGGFAGAESNREQRDAAGRGSILDGGGGGSVVTAIRGGYRDSLIDGFTIRNGSGTTPPGLPWGGGIYCEASWATFSNNTITGNTAFAGAGIFGNASSPIVSGNLVGCNTVVGSNAHGGGMSFDGPGSPIVMNNTITGNTAPYGGGIDCYTTSITISNNLIAGNMATISGGGISCQGGANVTAANNTITGNVADSSGGGIYCSAGTMIVVNNIVAFNSSGIFGAIRTLRNNCVYNPGGANYTNQSPGTGDICVDPQLLAVDYRGVHLKAGSPCIDAGLDSAVSSGWVDTDGQARVQGAHVDIGADEFVGTTPSFSPKVVRVSPAGNDVNDGSSWALAKLTVQAGIDAAAVLDGSEVWVAAGTYNERIALKLWVHVYGGFVGTESSRDERDWTSHVTILDGGAGGSVVSALSGSGMCGVDGFTIRNGTGTGRSGSGNGGGVYCISSLPIISNNAITGNTAARGGGISCLAPATISNNVITGNTAIVDTYGDSYTNSCGGGIWCGSYGSPTVCSAIISNNTITGNSAGLSTGSRAGYGGGICCGNYSSAVISNNTIEGNWALVGTSTGTACGGGVYCDAGCSPTLVGNTIRGNTAESSGSSGSGMGGGIYCNGGCSAAVSNNVVAENRAVSGQGGGMYCVSSGAISNNTIVANQAGRNGGGIYSRSSGAISNNTIAANIAGEGGGLYCYCEATLSPAISNNIVAFNSSGIYKESSGTPVLRNNCVYSRVGYNYSGLAAGAGDISVDPRLVAVDYGRVHLAAGSPCVEAGENTVVQAGWVDMDGQARIQGMGVDIGADEYDGTAPTFSPRAVRVSSAGDDSNDGSSWSLAKRTVQAGIDAALGAGGGEVWVAAGVYNERVNVGRWVHLFGGFGGTETSRDQRDWAARATVLDGGAGGAVVSMLDVGMCTVDGFTIRNGTGYVWSDVYSGGGICCFSLGTISHNRITGNTAPNGPGAGICCGPAIILSNTISGNGEAPGNMTSSMDGLGGGICCLSPAVIANNTITENGGNLGGGIYCVRLTAITNNTVAGNTARDGGAVYCGSYTSSLSDPPVISNNILAFNSSGVFMSPWPPVLSHNCVYNPGGYDYFGQTTGTGDIFLDPLFVDREAGDYRLLSGSSCIDAGTNTAVPSDVLTDLDGHARFVNDPAMDECTIAPGTCGTGPIVDMGAYEFVPGDYDRDGDVDLDDLAGFQGCATGPAVALAGDCAKADFDRDADVDQEDFGVFQRCFGGAGKALGVGC